MHLEVDKDHSRLFGEVSAAVLNHCRRRAVESDQRHRNSGRVSGRFGSNCGVESFGDDEEFVRTVEDKVTPTSVGNTCCFMGLRSKELTIEPRLKSSTSEGEVLYSGFCDGLSPR